MEHDIVKIIAGGFIIPAVCLLLIMKLMKK